MSSDVLIEKYALRDAFVPPVNPRKHLVDFHSFLRHTRDISASHQSPILLLPVTEVYCHTFHVWQLSPLDDPGTKSPVRVQSIL